MKRILAIIMALAMILSLAACGKTETAAQTETATEQETTEQVGLANPVVEYSSLQEIDGKLGVALMPLGNETDASYSIINDETAQYKFTIDGIDYTYRANPYTYEDISGIYGKDGLVFGNFHPGNDEPTNYVFTDEYKLARWFTESQVQYVLCAEDAGKLTEDAFKETVAMCQADTGVMMGFAYYDAMAGQYQDSYSQRATMEVESIGWEGVMITVWWGSSAFETDCWEMWARVSESDGLLSYNDCLHQRITFPEDESGEETYETIGENLSGFFSYDPEAKTLSWIGGEEGCTDCVFEWVAELPAEN